MSRKPGDLMEIRWRVVISGVIYRPATKGEAQDLYDEAVRNGNRDVQLVKVHRRFADPSTGQYWYDEPEVVKDARYEKDARKDAVSVYVLMRGQYDAEIIGTVATEEEARKAAADTAHEADSYCRVWFTGPWPLRLP